jgi:hypothetical protein
VSAEKYKAEETAATKKSFRNEALDKIQEVVEDKTG